MASRSLIVAASTALLLAGCAWGPRVDITSPAPLPTSATTYRLVEADPATGVDGAVAAAVRRQLQARGWRETREAPAWRMEAVYAVRPQKTGSYSDISAGEQAWVVEPRLPQWWGRGRQVHSLTLILIGPGDSTTVYQSAAVATARPRDPDAMIERLAEAAAGALAPGA